MTTMTKCGGTSDVKAADEDIRSVCEKVRQSVMDKLGSTSTVYEVVSYKSQVVAGTNYFVKIKVDEDKYIHARIFQPLPCANEGPELNSIQEDKTLEDEIEYF